jgi:restriction endonuclease S subunit
MMSIFMQINELCAAKMGYSFRQKPDCIENGNALVIQPKDVTSDGVIKVDPPCRINFPAGKSLNKGDVLLINRGRFTACVFEDTLGMPCVATSAFLILTPKDPKQLLPDYLALFLNSTDGQTILRRLNETTTIPFISLGNVESIEIPVPPLEMQQKLVDLEQAKQRFAQLTARKTELLNRIINQQLARADLVSVR